MAVDLNKVRPVAMWPVGDLREYENNARTHDPKQLRELARSIEKYGWTNPLLIDESGALIAGHGRLAAAKIVGVSEVPCIVVDGLSDDEKRALVLADNQLATLSGWDEELLAKELAELAGTGFDISGLGFDDKELNKLLADIEIPAAANDSEGEAAERPGENMDKKNAEAHSQAGTVWQLGRHRVMCGDSTSEADVEALTGGEDGQLIHADPPYGMGKASDGVANDNLYREKLDAFQMAWWTVWRKFTVNNGSAYIWGNAPDLWRLWYVGGLADSERLTMRSEVVWNKGSAGAGGISHSGLKGIRQYPIATERCLFFMLGQQGFNTNSDNYWEGWEPIRLYLVKQVERCGWSKADVNRITGTQMAAHWLTKSQFMLINEENYNKLVNAARERDAFKREHDALKQEFYQTRAHFNNSHDTMTDVWEFPTVIGTERHGHATPKPVAMMERIMKTSLPRGGVCLEPFGGSGSTLMGAENTGRVCFTMELQPHYVDTIVKRWQNATGQQAVNAETGEAFPVPPDADKAEG